MNRGIVLSILVTAAAAFAGPRLNQFQVIGTHNSYQVAPHPLLAAVIRSHCGAVADTLEYTHRPLAEQFERLGCHQGITRHFGPFVQGAGAQASWSRFTRCGSRHEAEE